MVGGTAHQQQQAPQLAPPSSSSASTAPITTPEEDELMKRNTDCVYFLASPLTCKKGSECEYRHSDIARVNPRDCWYWLNGNCLNPKCAFRHPPLDGLLEAEASTPMGPSAPASHAAPYGMPKQGVACIFFQKGFCLKGHLCPFLHGPPSSVNYKTAQPGSSNPVTEPPKIAYSGPDKSIQEQKITQPATVQKPVEFQFPQGKQAHLPARNGGNSAVDKKVQLPSSTSVEEPPRFKPARVVPPPVMNETRASKPDRSVYHAYHVSENDRIMNGKDADEYSRDPSPGFDVLVDNKHGDSEYYRDKDEFGRSRGHDYDIDRPTDYERDMYHEQRDYDHYNERDGQYAWDDHRASSERMLVGSAHLERRPHPRSDSPDHFNESDLRHRISKQRRGSDNGLRSFVSREYARENHADWVPRRDSHHHHLDQGALSSRLRGRIKIPGRSMSPPNENNPRMEREIDIGRRHQSRYSPGRPMLLNQSRLRDRIKGRVSEDNNNDGRDYKGLRGHGDQIYDNDTKFAGPKRLSELKSGRSSDGHEQQLSDGQVLGKRKVSRVESRQTEDDMSFEGPKPLSEILKRKRGVDNCVTSVNNNNSKENNKKETEIISGSTVSTNEEQDYVLADFEPEKQTGSSNMEKEKDQTADGNYEENEGGLMDEDALLDEELEAYDHREGDYDYEQIDGEEDYNLDEGEYVDEEDGEKDNVVYE